MALQGSGQISYGDIQQEFGPTGSGGIGAYRVTESIGNLSNLGLDNNQNNPPTSEMPQGSSSISFSDFYSRRLNVVVDHHSGSTQYRQIARDRYNSNNVRVIGGFKGRPSNSGGTQVIIHVNKTFGSENSGQNHCALRTGSWDSNTLLQVDVGSSGRIYGAGGDGGNGSREDGESGESGSSGLGVQYSPCKLNVRPGGLISAGFGGGGGGGGGHDHDKNSERHAGGGGGGGGAGLPAGEGGNRATGSEEADGGNGTDGNTDTAGEGGHGSNNENEATGGAGGEGGQSGEEANEGGSGGGGEGSENRGGEPGDDGSALRRTNSGYSVTISNSGTIRPSTSLANGVG